jgi:hypothetical protein
MQTRFDIRPRKAYPGKVGKHKVNYEPYVNNTATLPQIDTVTLVLETGVTYNVVINSETFSYVADVGDVDTDVRDALVAAINLSGQELIAAAASATTFTVIGADGVPHTISANVVGATTGALTVANTQAAVETAVVPIGRAIIKVATNADDQAQLGAPDANLVFVGVAFDSNTMLNDLPLGSPQIPKHQYGPGEIMSVAIRGSVWVSVEEDVSPMTDVFHRYDSTGETGVFRATASAGCAQIVSARWLSSAKAGEIAELMLGI